MYSKPTWRIGPLPACVVPRMMKSIGAHPNLSHDEALNVLENDGLGGHTPGLHPLGEHGEDLAGGRRK
eukprot:2935563-Alexandrium_andersonii.AAC.1